MLDLDLEDGGLRMLEVDNRVMLFELIYIRLVVISGDVIYLLVCLVLGIKCDVYLGRLN